MSTVRNRTLCLLPVGRVGRLKLFHRLIDRERRRPLSRRKLLERLDEFGDDVLERRPPSWWPFRCGKVSWRRRATCSCAGHCRWSTSRSCLRRSRVRRGGVVPDPRGDRGRSSCRGTRTAICRTARCFRASYGCERACGSCSASRTRAFLADSALGSIRSPRPRTRRRKSSFALESGDQCRRSFACRLVPNAGVRSDRPRRSPST